MGKVFSSLKRAAKFVTKNIREEQKQTDEKNRKAFKALNIKRDPTPKEITKGDYEGGTN